MGILLSLTLIGMFVVPFLAVSLMIANAGSTPLGGDIQGSPSKRHEWPTLTNNDLYPVMNRRLAFIDSSDQGGSGAPEGKIEPTSAPDAFEPGSLVESFLEFY